MRRIEKGAEPAALVEARETPGVSWKSCPDGAKDALRVTLFETQGGLCAYCMSPLPDPCDPKYNPTPERGGMKVEHWLARNEPDIDDQETHRRTWSWPNMLGVCNGTHAPEGTCDTHRGNLPPAQQALHVHPGEYPPDAGRLFRTTTAGELLPAITLHPAAAALVDSDIRRLNLNAGRLQRNRAAVLDVVRSRVGHGGHGRQRRLLDLLAEFRARSAEGRLLPYCEVAIQYVEKRLA